MSLNENKRLNFYGRRVGRTLSDKQKEGLSFVKPFQIDLPQKPFSKEQWDDLIKGRDVFFEIGFVHRSGSLVHSKDKLCLRFLLFVYEFLVGCCREAI